MICILTTIHENENVGEKAARGSLLLLCHESHP